MTISPLAMRLADTAVDATTAQLLAVLAGDDAAELYRNTGRLRPVLEQLEDHALEPLTRARLLALRALHERLAAEPPTDGSTVSTPSDAARLFAHLAALDHEEFWVAFLTRRNTVLGVAQVGIGGPAHVVVTPHQVFRPAIRRNASGVILAHVHPSGDEMPSSDDRALTVRLVAAGNELAIQVLDHLIIAPGGRFFSFVASGEIATVRR